MSTEFKMTEAFCVVEASSEMVLLAHNIIGCVESESLPPDEMIAALMRGIQGCLYSSDLDRETFIKRFIDGMWFEGSNRK